MVEMPNVAGDQYQAAGLRGCGNQTIPVADRCATLFPFSAEITCEDGKGFVQWQHRQVWSQISGEALPKLVSQRRNLRSVPDFFEADDGREKGFRFGFKPRFDARVGLEPHQLAQDIGVEQIHGSIKRGCRRAGFMMAFLLNLFEDLKNRVIIGNAAGIEVRAIRLTRELSPLDTGANHRLPGQSIANCPLILGRQAFHELNDMQGDRTHHSTFAEFRRDVKGFPRSRTVRQSQPPPWDFAAEFGPEYSKMAL